jgi:hypothetical protein
MGFSRISSDNLLTARDFPYSGGAVPGEICCMKRNKSITESSIQSGLDWVYDKFNESNYFLEYFRG